MPKSDISVMKNYERWRCFVGSSVLLMSVVAIFVLGGCDRSKSNKPSTSVPANGTPKLTKRIVAVSYPLQYLTQRIVGDAVKVEFVAPPESDPQTWRPSREVIGEIQSADLIIANGTGATYAKWLTLVSLPDSKVRHTASRGMSLRDYIAVEDVTIVHSHGPEGEHSHPTMVARTWLDPAIAKKQAVYIAKELGGVYPELVDSFNSNLESLAADLDGLSALLKSNDQTNVRILTTTPKLKFFSRAIGLADHHFTWFETPTVERAQADLANESGDAQTGIILFDNSLPSQEILQVLKKDRLEPIAVSLIDHAPLTGDFLTELHANIEKVREALGRLEQPGNHK